MHPRLTGLVIVVAVCVACGGSDGGGPTGPGGDIERGPVTAIVTGIVQDDVSNPVSGAIVRAWDVEGSRAVDADTTTAKGSYTLNLPSFALGKRLEIRAGGLSGYRDSLDTVVITNSETQRINLVLARIITTAVVGVITDANGNPVAQVTVTTDPTSTTTTTDEQGRFRIDFPVDSETTITVRAVQGGVTYEEQVILRPAQETPVGIVITPVGSLVVIGKVSDVLGGNTALEGASVVLRDSTGVPIQTARFDAEGSYHISVTGQVGEVYIVDADRVGFAPLRDTVTVQGDTTVVDFQMSLAVVGRVEDLRGEPVTGAIVSTQSGTAEGSVNVNDDGTYILTLNQDAGGDTVVVDAAGFVRGSQWVPFSRDSENRADFRLDPAENPAPQVSPDRIDFGLLADKDTLLIGNSAQAGTLSWSVSATPPWLSVSSSSGEVEAGGESSPVVLTIDRNAVGLGDGIQESGTIDLVFNSSTLPQLPVPVTVDIQSIGGTVLSRSGSPVAGAEVTLRQSVEETAIATGLSDEQGRYAVGMVPAGSYVLVVENEAFISSIETATISLSGTTPLDVEMLPLPTPAEIVYESDVPFRIMIDQDGDGDRAYVLVRTNPPDNTIKVVSGLLSGQATTSRAGGDITVGSGPTDGAFFNGDLVVACYEDSAVWIVDLITMQTTRIPTSPGPFGIDVSGNRAYVVCEGSGAAGVLEVIDLVQGSVVESFAMPELVTSLGDEPWGPDVAVSGGLAFVSNNQEVGQVFVVDTSSGQIQSSLNVAGRPQQILRQEGRFDLFTLSKAGDGEVGLIDGLTGTKSRTIRLDAPPQFLRAIDRVSSIGGRDLLLMVYGQTLVFYDLDVESEVGRLEFIADSAARAVSVAVTPDGEGVLIGLERGDFGRRLVFLSF